jgi:hypothetical protein
MIAFVHCEKAAGSTLGGILREYFGESFVSVGSRKDRRSAIARLRSLDGKTRAIRGHIPLGVMLRHLPPETRYITLLRDPIERTVSHYFYLCEARATREFSRSLMRQTPRGSLLDALGERRVLVDNHQTRMLSGDPDAWRNWRRQLAANALADARKSLRDSFCAFGLVERFDDSVRVILDALGLPMVESYESLLVSNRPQTASLTDEEREALVRHNRMDLDLHRYARELFAQRYDYPAPARPARR